MKKSEAERWLEENSSRLNIDYRDIHRTESGESNHNFVVEGEEKMVLRVSRDISRESRLENEAEKLEFLESEGFDCVPRKIHFEKDTDIGDVLLETYVGSKDIGKKDLNEARIRSLAKNIARIHSIPARKYEKFSGTKTRSDRTLKEVFQEDFRKWSRRPFEEYLELAGKPDERIRKFFERQKELLDRVPDIEIDQGLTHGDLGFNLRASGDRAFIIDWEFSRFDYPENEILYCFEHEDLDREQRKIFLEEYRKHRKLGNGFEKVRKIYPKFLAFNDMIWAAKRVEKGDDKQELFEERLEKLEEYYIDREEQ
jgi:thiamine kinase-like enzyme